MNTVIQVWIEHPDRPSADLLRYMRSIKNESTPIRGYNLISAHNYFAGDDPNANYEWININDVVSDFLDAYPQSADSFGLLIPQHKSDVLRMFIMSTMPNVIYMDCDVDIGNAILNGLFGKLETHDFVFSSNLRTRTSIDSCISGRGVNGDLFLSEVLNRMLVAIQNRSSVFYDSMFKVLNKAVEDLSPSFFRVSTDVFVHHHGE